MFKPGLRTVRMAVFVVLVAAIGTALSFSMATNKATAQAQDISKICLSTDVNGRGDLSFNDMAIKGMNEAVEAFDIDETEVAVPGNEQNFLPTLRQFARSGECSLILAIGALLGDATQQAAQEFPDQKFAIVDTAVDQPNVLNLLFKEQDSSAVLGALAAMVAAENDFPGVGIVLGIELPVLWRFEAGYRRGIAWGEDFYERATGESVDIELSQSYTGTFNDVAAVKSAAQSQLAQGAGVVYQVAGQAGLGVFEAIQERLSQEGQQSGPPFALGVDANQDYLANGNKILASGMKRVDVATFTAIERVVNGTFEGDTLTFGLETGGVAMSRFADLEEFIEFGLDAGAIEEENVSTIKQNWLEMRESIPHFIWDGVNELENQIVEGEVVPPSPENREDIEQVRQEYP